MAMTNGKAIRKRAKALAEAALELKAELIRHRDKHKLSQKTVAERMGVSQPTVSELERYDSNPTLRTLQKYANAIDVRIEFKVVDDCGNAERSNPTLMNEEMGWTKQASSLGTNNVRLRIPQQVRSTHRWSPSHDRVLATR